MEFRVELVRDRERERERERERKGDIATWEEGSALFGAVRSSFLGEEGGGREDCIWPVRS